MSGTRPATWRRSTRSDDSGGECVEVAVAGTELHLRDSKDPAGPVLAVGRHAFRSLLAEIKAGSLDR